MLNYYCFFNLSKIANITQAISSIAANKRVAETVSRVSAAEVCDGTGVQELLEHVVRVCCYP